MGRYQRKRPVISEIIGSDMLLVPETWLYRWTVEPPYEFCLFKVLFQARTPVDIVHHGWRILEPAVSELTENLNLPSVSGIIDLLKLNSVPTDSCSVGVNHHEETVVAASGPGTETNHFIPYRFFEKLSVNPAWHEPEYTCSYRHFVARFQTGRTFYTDRHSMLCDLVHTLHFGIHGVHSLRTTVRVGGTPIVVPVWFRVSGTLCDLPGKVDRMARLAQSFIGKLGSAWLPCQDPIDRAMFVVSMLRSISLPDYMLNEFRKDTKLNRCLTKLDLLLYLSGKLQTDSMIPSSDMYRLSRTLFFKR